MGWDDNRSIVNHFGFYVAVDSCMAYSVTMLWFMSIVPLILVPLGVVVWPLLAIPIAWGAFVLFCLMLFALKTIWGIIAFHDFNPHTNGWWVWEQCSCVPACCKVVCLFFVLLFIQIMPICNIYFSWKLWSAYAELRDGAYVEPINVCNILQICPVMTEPHNSMDYSGNNKGGTRAARHYRLRGDAHVEI